MATLSPAHREERSTWRRAVAPYVGGSSRFGRLLRRIGAGLILALAFILPPLLVGGAGAAHAFLGQRAVSPPALDLPLPERPAHDPSKQTAVIVAGNHGTESSDLLGPYETLTTSGQFNVYVVAPERVLSPLFPGDLALVPHYSFAEYDAAFGGVVDLVVVPYIVNYDSTDASVVTWIRQKADAGSTILSICAGAIAVADAGVLDGRQATTHHFSMLQARQDYPGVTWVEGQRYVDAGQFISSAGVTSGVDATLYTLGRMFGREAAAQTAQAMGYPHARFLDDPASTVRISGDTGVWPSFYGWDRTDIGLVLYDGVREVEISSAIDTYPRTLGAFIHTLAPKRTFIRTRHGLDLVPHGDFATAPSLDRLLVPGTSIPADGLAVVQTWAAQTSSAQTSSDQRNRLTVEQIHAAGGYPYDATFGDIARSQGNGVARSVANVLEYPVRDLVLDGPALPWSLALRPLALGLLGLGVALWLRRRPAVLSGIGRGLRFTLHFAEMSLAMVAGMVAFHLLAGMPGHGAAAASESAVAGSPAASASWSVAVAYEVGMMIFMTVPMVVWMLARGHSLRHGIEMSVGMLAPVIAIDLLVVLGADALLPWLQQASGPAMVLGMLAAMLYRPGHYLGGHRHIHQPAPVAAAV